MCKKTSDLNLLVNQRFTLTLYIVSYKNCEYNASDSVFRDVLYKFSFVTSGVILIVTRLLHDVKVISTSVTSVTSDLNLFLNIYLYRKSKVKLNGKQKKTEIDVLFVQACSDAQ